MFYVSKVKEEIIVFNYQPYSNSNKETSTFAILVTYAMDLRRYGEGQSIHQSISGSPGRKAQSYIYQLGQLSIWKQIKILK